MHQQQQDTRNPGQGPVTRTVATGHYQRGHNHAINPQPPTDTNQGSADRVIVAAGITANNIAANQNAAICPGAPTAEKPANAATASTIKQRHLRSNAGFNSIRMSGVSKGISP